VDKKILLENENIIYYQQEKIEYLQFKKLLNYSEVKHCYTLKSRNELNFPPIYKDEETLKNSYKRICKCLNLKPENIVKPHQTHSDNIKIVEKIQDYQEVDGVLTNKEDIVLLTTSADCISLLFYDYIKKVVGSVHSGWRGTLQQISKKAVEKMIDNYGSNPQNIICCICPSIRQCCFEVDEDVKDLFKNKYKNLNEINTIIQKGIIKENKQKFKIDTAKINKILLKQIGLKEENIIDSNICTVCNNKDFHSYRVDKENSGRNAALINLSL